MTRLLALALGVGALLCAAPSLAAEPETPAMLALEGRLRHPDGRSFDGAARFTARIYAEAEGGEPLYEETDPIVFGPGGSFATDLGDTVPLELPFDRSYWVGFSIDEGPELSPRLPVREVPMALRARVAGRLGGYAAAEFMLRDGSTGMSGPLSLGGHRIQDLAPPGASTDAATRAYVDRRILELAEYARGLHRGFVDPAVSLRTDQELEQAAAYVRARSGARIVGRIMGTTGMPDDPRRPTLGATVTLIRSDPRRPFRVQTISTDAAGRYAFHGLEFGDYRIEVTSPDHAPGIQLDPALPPGESLHSFQVVARPKNPSQYPEQGTWPSGAASPIPPPFEVSVRDLWLQELVPRTVVVRVFDSVTGSPLSRASVGSEMVTGQEDPAGTYTMRWKAVAPTSPTTVRGYAGKDGFVGASFDVADRPRQTVETAVTLAPATATITGRVQIAQFRSLYDPAQIRIFASAPSASPPRFGSGFVAKDGTFAVAVAASGYEERLTYELRFVAPNLYETRVANVQAPSSGGRRELASVVILRPILVDLSGEVRDSSGNGPNQLSISGIPDMVVVQETGHVANLIQGRYTLIDVPATSPSGTPEGLTLLVNAFNPSRPDGRGALGSQEFATVTIRPIPDGASNPSFEVPLIQTSP